MDPAWAALAAVASPLVLVVLSGRQQRGVTRENWRRQDEVAKRAEDAAAVVTARAEATAVKVAEAAKLLLVTNERVAASHASASAEISGRLEQIHVLVNSELTEAQRRELAATEALLVRVREVMDLKREHGIELTVADGDSEVELEIRIDGMAKGLAEKAVQTRIADAQVPADSP